MHVADRQLVERYFDHGATSFPKPESVGLAMLGFLDGVGGTYGRSAYTQARDASRMIFDTRERLAELFGCKDSSRVVFTCNATHALNIVIQGLVREGGTVWTSPMEHNSVMRPLSLVSRRLGVQVKTLPHCADGSIDPEKIELDAAACLVVVNHQSNVNGVIQPLAMISKRTGSVPFLVDAAQSAGDLDIDMARDGIDLLAAPGHKHLLGPTGTGLLVVGDGIDVRPLMPGGTGSGSEETEQPVFMPDALEGGTPNIVGIWGLNAACKFIQERGTGPLGRFAVEALERLRSIDGISLFAAKDPISQGGLFSFNIEGLTSSAVAHSLFDRHGLAVRSGLHCAPAAHRTLGTFDGAGTVRVSFGRFHDDGCVDRIVGAIADVASTRP